MSCPDIKSQEPPSGGFLLQITKPTTVSFLICYEGNIMAKPDWSELQKQFLSDHAKSGISPKEWCEG